MTNILGFPQNFSPVLYIYYITQRLFLFWLQIWSHLLLFQCHEILLHLEGKRSAVDVVESYQVSWASSFCTVFQHWTRFSILTVNICLFNRNFKELGWPLTGKLFRISLGCCRLILGKVCLNIMRFHVCHQLHSKR